MPTLPNIGNRTDTGYPSFYPIIKIKRGNNSIPSGLTAGELAVDLGANTFYVGNESGISVPIGSEVSTDNTLGGTPTTASDNKIVTQKAIRNFVTGSFLANPPRETLFANIAPVQSLADSSDFQPITLENESTSIVQSSNMGLQYIDSANPFYTGFFQTTKTRMILEVSYSVHISSLTYWGPSTTDASGLGGFWRQLGIRRINTRALPAGQLDVYGVQIVNPAIGTQTNPVPTWINGNAIIELPKSTLSGPGQAVWELQLVYKTKTYLNNLYAGWSSGFGTADPEIGPNSTIRLQITKLYEE